MAFPSIWVREAQELAELFPATTPTQCEIDPRLRLPQMTQKIAQVGAATGLLIVLTIFIMAYKPFL